ncbi:hypothetical protein DSECCO2_661090 [anaerobic digester metagenome]
MLPAPIKKRAKTRDAIIRMVIFHLKEFLGIFGRIPLCLVLTIENVTSEKKSIIYENVTIYGKGLLSGLLIIITFSPDNLFTK